MFRSYAVLLLLLNYLLVVGAGLVERPARVIDRPFAYVHSHHCQQLNALRIGCFDDCNGVQYTVQKNGGRPPITQLLTSLKGLDTHYLPDVRVVFTTPIFWQAGPRLAARELAVPPGFGELIELPPQRG
ncbi:hypothetical protein [Hymenobacter terrenus]|uniref:hypothetical protein n=1 Tax=Hymenobacter terrenus TaxID=1629124 RepID=UPI0006192550|nr:hypothetical protein [Hymenobacter terrenus]